MEKFTPLLLKIWREACRNIKLAESIDRIASILVQRLPVSLVIVRRLHIHQRRIETVAVALNSSPTKYEESQTKCDAEQMEILVRWCKEGNLFCDLSSKLDRCITSLSAKSDKDQIIVVPLGKAEDPMGLVVMVAAKNKGFSATHEEIAAALKEPFTLALENDQKVRDLSQQREAAVAERQSLLSRVEYNDISNVIIGRETGLRSVMQNVELVAKANSPVLILGETGSGKEVVSRTIHQRSQRIDGPFHRVNCGAIPSELIDSELFGHERGSFTGAVQMRKGWFERADGGTLFLDEVGELPLAAQVRLLRILQDGSFERVGGQHQLFSDVRIIAATNQDLKTMVDKGSFREDLWYRIAVFVIQIPPLRERKDDIPALATHFARKVATRMGLPPMMPTTKDIELLLSYSWPGNARELSSVIERAAILGNGHSLQITKALGNSFSATSTVPEINNFANDHNINGENSIRTLDDIIIGHIKSVLKLTRGRIDGPYGAAKILEVNPHTLRSRMRKYGIDWKQFRD